MYHIIVVLTRHVRTAAAAILVLQWSLTNSEQMTVGDLRLSSEEGSLLERL